MTEHTNINNNSAKDANDIQMGIEAFTKKIEHEKINLRLCEERYQKQLDTYFILCGKPIPKTKEQKEKERKEQEKTNSLSISYKKAEKKENLQENGKIIFSY